MPKINVGFVAVLIWIINIGMANALSLVVSGNNCATYESDKAYTCTQNNTTNLGYDGYTVRACKTCKSGYVLGSVFKSVTSACKLPVGVSVVSCEAPTVPDECDSDADCTPSGTIAIVPGITTGYDYDRSYVCNNPDSETSTCSTEYSFSCDSGYYGKTSDIQCEETTQIIGNASRVFLQCSAGCDKCPSFVLADGSTIPGNSALGSTDIYDCNIGPVDGLTDASGTYSLTSECNYSDSCSSVTGVLNTTSGIQYQVLSGRASRVSGGRYCWCNVLDENKYFYYGPSSTVLCPTVCERAVATNKELRTNLVCK